MAREDYPDMTIGRNGIKLPEVRFNEDSDTEWNVGLFFRELWDLNLPGDTSEDDKRAGLPFLRELVVPPHKDKPLVVVRGQYTPTSEFQRRANVASNRRQNSFDNSGGFGMIDERVVTVGVEENSILLVPSDRSLAWKSLITWHYNRKGGTSLIDAGQLDRPTISFLNQEKVYDEAWGEHKEHSYEQRQAIVNKGVASILHRFVELVS